MNAPPLILLFLISACHGGKENGSPAPAILTTTKEQKKIKTALENPCPESTDILPCQCSNQDLLTMDCSKVQNEEQLRKVFSAYFPRTDFDVFNMSFNKGLKVLEEGVFGDVSFQMINIQYSVLETVTFDALRPSLSTLKSIYIMFGQLAMFPFERLAEFTSLLTLYIRENSIHSLPPLSSASLLFLSVAGNPIPYLSPDVFSLVSAVEQIYLSGCNLTEITPGMFKGLPLVTLYLADNKITHLKSLTFDMVSSSSSQNLFLFLAGNNISVVEVDAFKGVPGSSEINLDNNAITTLEEEVWKPVLEKDIGVSLNGNFLSCGCDVAWLVKDPQLLTMIWNGRCADGTPLENLSPSDFDICG